MELETIYNAKVIERENLHDELALIRIAPDSGQVEPFKPGQFCTIGMPPSDESAFVKPDGSPRKRPKLIRRAYSIASPATVRDYLELYVVLVGEGKLTPKLWTIEQEGRLWLDERIRGEFTLDHVPTGKDYVMISTGTGLAPFLSMLKTYRDTGRWRRLVMIHGVRLAEDLGYREELEQIAAEDDSVFYIPVCSREPEDSQWQGLRGRVNAALDDQTFRSITGFEITPADTHLFLCGNPAMIADVQETYEKRGLVTSTKKHPGNIHFERYW